MGSTSVSFRLRVTHLPRKTVTVMFSRFLFLGSNTEIILHNNFLSLSVAEDDTLFVKMAALLKLDARKFVIDNKEQIMNSLLEVEDFEQVSLILLIVVCQFISTCKI